MEEWEGERKEGAVEREKGKSEEGEGHRGKTSPIEVASREEKADTRTWVAEPPQRRKEATNGTSVSGHGDETDTDEGAERKF